MKFLRYGNPGAEKPGLMDENGIIRDLSGVIKDIDHDILSKNLAPLQDINTSTLPIVESDTRIGPPISNVSKFICVGLNYSDHATEAGLDIPTEPVLFMKATSSIVGPNDSIEIPRYSEKLDWEVELGVVIGKEAKYVSIENALDHIAGLCVVHDVSERSFQLERGGQWAKGKGCDTFGPIGPYLVTLDEIEDLSNLPLWLNVNGEKKQAGNTKDLIFSIPFLVHYISNFLTLKPGDIVSTGTPPGVGLGMSPQEFLQAGDEIELGIQGLGVQKQTVRQLPLNEGSLRNDV